MKTGRTLELPFSLWFKKQYPRFFLSHPSFCLYRFGPQEDAWSQSQQQQLEAALARFPMGMDKNERWAAIAAAVPGKSKKQCVERFKFVKTQLLAKKKAEKKAAETATGANGGGGAPAASAAK